MSMMVNSGRFGIAGAAVSGSEIITTTPSTGSSTIAIPIPSGASAGDTCVIFVGLSWSVNSTPSGWSRLYNVGLSNWGGAAFFKKLTSGDISTGTVTLSLSGGHAAAACSVAIAGAVGIRTFIGSGNSTSGSTRALTTDALPNAGDKGIYFGSARVNASSSVDRGGMLEQSTDTSTTGCLYSETIGSDGSFTANFAYGGTPTPGGDFQAICVMGGDFADYVTDSRASGNRSSLITSTASGITFQDGSTVGNLVNGSLGNNTSQSCYWNPTTGNGTGYMKFDFGSGNAKTVRAFEWIQSNGSTHGVWRFAGSNDDSSYTTLGDITLTFGQFFFDNDTAYRYYRLTHMSGSRTDSPWLNELNFMIEA